MLVISDTSPLNYLVLIDAVQVLAPMYGRVIVPQAVADELSAEGTPAKARHWFAARPAWLEIHPEMGPADYPHLDAGEAQAIALAKLLHADLLLIDERQGTHIARQTEGLATTGTLGVLLDASRLGLIDLPTALHRLEHETTFHASPTLYQQLLEVAKAASPPQSP